MTQIRDRIETIQDLKDYFLDQTLYFNASGPTHPESDNSILLYLLILFKEELFDFTENSEKPYSPKEIKTIILDNKSSSSLTLKSIYDKVYKKSLINIWDQTLDRLFQVFKNYKQLILDNFQELFDDLLASFCNNNYSRKEGFVLSKELSQFTSLLSNINDDSLVYNPYCGYASLGIFLNEHVKFYGQEINNRTWALGCMRLLAYNKKNNYFIANEDSNQNWNPKNLKYDLIISNPPIGIKKAYGGKDRPFKDVESDLIYAAKDTLKENGKAIILVPSKFNLYQKYFSLRKELVSNDLLETVITFPTNFLSESSLSFSIIVLNKAKKKEGVVNIVNAKSFINKVGKNTIDYSSIIDCLKNKIPSDNILVIQNNKIKINDYRLDYEHYLLVQIEGTKLGDLMEIIPARKEETPKKGKFLRIRDLSINKFDCELDTSKLLIEELPDTVKEIHQSALLIAVRWNAIKPTYFNYAQEPIFISNDIMAFKVNQKIIDKSFLIIEMYNDSFLKQLSILRKGETIPFFSLKDFLTLKIKLPKLSDQFDRIENEKKDFIISKQKEIEELRKKYGLFSDIESQNSFLRHTIAGNLASLRSSFNKINKIFNDEIVNHYPEILNLKVEEGDSLNFEKLLSIANRDIIKISNEVNKNSLGERIFTNVDLKPIDICSFLSHYLNEIYNRSDRIFNLDWITEIDDVNSNGYILTYYVNGNADLLTKMFDNIFDNIVKHAFQNKKKNSNYISVEVYDISDNLPDTLSVQINNSGKPLPNGFNYNLFKSKGGSAGANAGDGFGGWLINKVINIHDADYHFDSDMGDYQVTRFTILFPILSIE